MRKTASRGSLGRPESGTRDSRLPSKLSFSLPTVTGIARRTLTYEAVARDRNPHVRSAAGQARGVRGAPVGLGDSLDDGQAQSGAACRAALIGPGETLEGARKELGRDAGPGIGYMQLDETISFHRSQPDRRSSVVQRVVNQVRQGLLEA